MDFFFMTLRHVTTARHLPAQTSEPQIPANWKVKLEVGEPTLRTAHKWVKTLRPGSGKSGKNQA